MPRAERSWRPTEIDDEDYPGIGHPGLSSQQFVVTDNPVIGVLFGADGKVIATHQERDNRFGFAKWVEDRDAPD